MLQILKGIFTYYPENPLIFTNPYFWLLFFLVLLTFHFFYEQLEKRNLFLLVVSFYFFYKTGGLYFFLIVFSTFLDYTLGFLIFRASSKALKKLYLSLSVIINLGVLSYYKYSYFFISFINQFFESQIEVVDILALFFNQMTNTDVNTSDIILPIGISFYTFQTISYSVDIYRGKIRPISRLLDFAFYVSFFPQLVAGPIIRAAEFVPQIYKKYQLNYQEYSKAIFLIMSGLIKKMLIANFLAESLNDRVFQNPIAYSGLENLMAVYGYALQIYCDFSGYTDIAIGLALLLGFRLPKNFNSPYAAQNISDFWRRWHISLSAWLRDYLYISLGGNRKGKFRTYINLMITMLLGGLWHGASWKFVIWGALHGIALMVHRFWREKYPAEEKSFLQKFLGKFLTFHFVLFCWIFFRAADMKTVGIILWKILTDLQISLLEKFISMYFEVSFVMLLGYLIHWLPRSFKDEIENFFMAMPDLAKAVVIVSIIIGLYQVASSYQAFIYLQF